MAARNPQEVFLKLLSDVRQGTERTTKVFQELSQIAQDPDVKEALEARIFVSDQILARLDQCFKLIGEKPVQLSGRLHDVFVEDFRREMEIESRGKASLHPGQGHSPDSLSHGRVCRSHRGSRYERPLRRWSTAGKLPCGQTRLRGTNAASDQE